MRSPDLAEYLSRDTSALKTGDDLVRWTWGISPCGKASLVAVAHACAHVWRTGVPASGYWHARYANHLALSTALEAATAWNRCPCATHLGAVQKAATAASALLERMYQDNMSGGIELQRALRRAIEAADATVCAASAAAWTPADVPETLDPAERAAQIATGPAHLAALAVLGAARAIDADVPEIFGIVRAGV